MNDNQHILEAIKLYFGIHRYLKWPTLLVLLLIGSLLLSKQVSESVEYWASKLFSNSLSTTTRHANTGAIAGSSLIEAPAQEPVKIAGVPATTPLIIKNAPSIKTAPTTPSKPIPKPIKNTQKNIPTKGSKKELEKNSAPLTKTDSTPTPTPTPTEIAPQPTTPQKEPTEIPLEDKAPNNRKIRQEVAVAISALNGETTSDRIRSVLALLPSLPNGLTSAEIIGLAGSETTSHREQILKVISKKITQRSIPGEEIPAILASETTSNRIRCIQILEPYIKAPVSGKSAASILGEETYSHRIQALQIIATLIQRPLSEADILSILDGTSTSDRTQAINLLLGNSSNN